MLTTSHTWHWVLLHVHGTWTQTRHTITQSPHNHGVTYMFSAGDKCQSIHYHMLQSCHSIDYKIGSVHVRQEADLGGTAPLIKN